MRFRFLAALALITAPTGGATITLASNSAHFPVPASVTVAAGQTSASVAVVAQ